MIILRSQTTISVQRKLAKKKRRKIIPGTIEYCAVYEKYLRGNKYAL
jgi:hypothetical protein